MNRVVSSLRQLTATACDIGIWGALLAATVAMPWYFGGITPTAQQWLFPLMLCGMGCGLLRTLLSPQRLLADAPVALPVILAIAFIVGWMQTVPLPPTLHRLFSPQGAAWMDELPPVAWSPTDQTPAPASTVSRSNGWYPISVAPSSTRHDLAVLSLGMGGYVLARLAFRAPLARLTLLVLLGGNGAALALFGIVQQLTWNGKLFWRVSLPEGAVPFGSYVNRNNGAGYLNMALGGAIGLLVWTLVRHRFNVIHQTAHGPSRRPPLRHVGVWEWLGSLDSWGVSALAMTICLAAGILCSASRGGVVAFGGAVLLVGGVLARGPRRLSTATGGMIFCALIGIGLAVWLGGGTEVRQRFASLLVDDAWSQDSRLLHWRDGIRAAANFLRGGSGLGTYRYVYGPFEHRVEPQWYLHAENQYLEATVEMGLIGPGLLVAAIGAAVYSMRRVLQNAAEPETYGLAVGGLFALGSQAVHACFDFGLYLPANAITLAVLCGATSVAQRSARGSNGVRSSSVAQPVVRKLWNVILVVAAGGAMLWANVEAGRFLLVAREERATPREDTYVVGEAEALRASIRKLTALAGRHHDSSLHVLLADRWIRLYRQSTTQSLLEQVEGTAAADQLWTFTEPTVLHARVCQLRATKDPATLAQLQSHPDVTSCLHPALLHLLAARDACPIRPKTHLAIAELLPLAVPSADDGPHVRHAVRLAPNEPDILFRAGLLHLQASRIQPGIRLWQQCLSGSREYRERILRMGPQLLGPVDFFEQLFRGLPVSVIDVAFEFYSGESERSVRWQLADLAEQSIGTDERHPSDIAFLRGRIAWLRDDRATARREFEQALTSSLQPAVVHYELARLLLVDNDVTEAQRHIHEALKEAPRLPKYRRLQQEIRQRRTQ